MDERAALAAMQREMLEQIVHGTLGADRVRDHSPRLIQTSLTSQHAGNLDDKVAFFFPTFHGQRAAWDAEPTPPTWNTTTAAHTDTLHRLFGWLVGEVATWNNPALWTDLLLLERARYLARDHQAASHPELVASAREVQRTLFEWAAPGHAEHGPLCFVRLRTNLFDTLGNRRWRTSDIGTFGPPRTIALFCVPTSGDVHEVPFSTLDELAVRVCFSR